MAPVDEHNVVLSSRSPYPTTTANKTVNSICNHDFVNNNHITARHQSLDAMRGRASSEFPLKMMNEGHVTQPRATSLGPTTANPLAAGHRRKPSYEHGIYECNYESIDGYSSKSDHCPTNAILQLENAVKCLDQVLEKDIKRMKYESRNDDYNPKKVQYDSITVMPTNPYRELPPTPTRELPPTPLPRTRSFRDGK